MPPAYSLTSVSDTYDSATARPASCSRDCRRRSSRQSGPSAMKATSALWPSMAAVTTWWSVASVALTAATTASGSRPGVGLQNRWSTPQPTLGATGSDGTASVGRLGVVTVAVRRRRRRGPRAAARRLDRADRPRRHGRRPSAVGRPDVGQLLLGLALAKMRFGRAEVVRLVGQPELVGVVHPPVHARARHAAVDG